MYLLMGVVFAIVIVGLVGVILVKTKNQHLRKWALQRADTLRQQGVVLGSHTSKRLQALAPSTVESGLRVNKFGIPVSKNTSQPKKLSRKQAKQGPTPPKS
jgi:hypothetical protein